MFPFFVKLITVAEWKPIFMLYLITFLSVFFVLEEWIFQEELFRRLTVDRVWLNPDSSLALSDLDIVDLLSKLDP